MVALQHCCGNQPVPIVTGLIVIFLMCFIDCYPLASSSSSSPSPGSTSYNLNLGHVVYRPNFSLHSSNSEPQSLSSSPSLSPKAPVVQSVVSSSSSPSSTPSVSQSSPSQLSSSSYHHLSVPEIALFRDQFHETGDVLPNNHRQVSSPDYFDIFRLPLKLSLASQQFNTGGSTGNTNMGNPINNNGLSNVKPFSKFISSPTVDFDYVPYLQSDLNQPLPLPPPPPSLPPMLLPSSSPLSSYGSERSSLPNDPYEEADYSDQLYDSKYDPLDDSNWLNEPTLSSYRQQSVLPSISILSSPSSFSSSMPSPPSPIPYSSYPQYLLPAASGNSGSNSEELLTNLMVDYFVKELGKNAQQQQQPQQSISSQSEPVQHVIRLKQQPIDELKAYEGYLEKKSSPSSSSFNRDKGSSIISTPTSDTNNDESNNKNNRKVEKDFKRAENVKEGQKEYPMLRPATENNGKDEIDNQSSSLTSQLQSLQSSSPSIPASSSSASSSTFSASKKSSIKPSNDDEVNQLKSLLLQQSA